MTIADGSSWPSWPPWPPWPPWLGQWPHWPPWSSWPPSPSWPPLPSWPPWPKECSKLWAVLHSCDVYINTENLSLGKQELCVSLLIKLSLFPTLVMIWCQMKSSCSFWNISIRSGHQLLIHWCSVMLAILLNVVFNGVIDFLMIFRACLRTSYYMPSYGIWLGRTKNFLIAQMLSGFVPKFVYNISAIVSNWSSGSDDVNWMPLPR